MSIIVEINQMRNNMGLNPINESDILNEANPLKGIAKLIDDVIKLGKVVFTNAEKSALDKFIISKNIDDFLKDELNSKTLKNFVNSANGKEFLEDLGELIAKEPDMRKRVGYRAYVDSLNELPTKKLAKEIGKEIIDIDKLVSELTDYSKLAIKKDPNLLSKIKLAKSKLAGVNQKNIQKLPQNLKDEILRLGDVIKSKNPGLWTQIHAMFPSLSKGWQKIGTLGRIAVILLAASTGLGAAIIKYVSPALKQGLCNLVSLPWICDGVSTPENETTPEKPDNGGKRIIGWRDGQPVYGN
jgi:hypothetical protein